MKRFITLTILIILSFLLQTTILSFHNASGFSPNLLMIITMSFGIMRGRREGMLVGFASGFLMDVFYNSLMGPYMFTCKLDSQLLTPETGSVDWRQGYDYGLKHEIIDTPIEIEQFCKQFLRRLNLIFGCFDFIVTPSDEIIFLECNPNLPIFLNFH